MPKIIIFSRRDFCFAFRVVSRPVIFISAVSKELKSARQLVANTLLQLGYEPMWQDIAGLEQGDLRAVLREKIDECAGLIQLVGHCYGLEPPVPDEQFGRVSYTQFEARYARERGQKVWYLLLDETFADDPQEVELDEPRALQAAYRQRICADGHLYHPIATAADLEVKVLKLRDELTPLRRRGKQRAALILGLLILSIVLGVWMVEKQTQIDDTATDTQHGMEEIKTIVADPVVLRAKLEEKIDVTFDRKRDELLTAKAPTSEIDAIYRWRDRAKEQVAEGVAFITARAANPNSPIVSEAVRTLNERGVDAALEFLDAKLKSDRQRRKEEGFQLAEASLMKAELHESRFETEEQERAIRAALGDFPEWWKPHSELGRILYRRAQWEAAEDEFRTAGNKTIPAGAEFFVLSDLGQVYQATNRLKEAESMMNRALENAEKSGDNPKIAVGLTNLAALYFNTARLTEAEPMMKRALEIDQRYYEKDDPKVAADLNNLGQLYQAKHRLTEAESMMKRALEIDERSPGRDRPDVARDLSNLAQLYIEMNRLAEAELNIKLALEIDTKSYGPEHPEVATDLTNLAQLYQRTKRAEEAKPLMERALKIDENSNGPEHPSVARDLNNLAQWYRDLNQLAEAEPLLRRSLLIKLKSSHAAGHMLSNLPIGVTNYQSLLTALSVPEAEIYPRIAAVVQEAGFGQLETENLLASILSDVVVKQVLAGGGGEGLGIQVGDIVRRYNGHAISKGAEFVKLVDEGNGDAIPLEIQRGDDTVKLTAKPGRLGLMLEDRPKPPPK
ncbi:MAG: tetratricopeptide repeat protein [Chthoniobacter sp.]|uniref:tetratricopeptide repeat protein n=1 Tax=Chthoniobacter sp. TaxID=2510640 RepID=UPI0032A21932